MSELVWHWTKGNKKIYTQKFDFAEKAMREGAFVKVLKAKPHIFKK